MRKAIFKSELYTSVALIIILVLLVKPTKLLMPQSLDMMLPIFLLVAFFVFTTLFWKESSADERENLHRLNAGRISFLIGSSFLTSGIIIQSLQHNVDPWLVYTLVAMILAKALSRIYSQIKD